ncbi:hypothetical protein [Geobacillus subterraneus]|uniref:hypothetical protein n=1 Tax=Geobacillus subterraneus TaxID=129338 RepID=UPI001FCFB7A0|nr:hypothetical protein [Geobacillus subterraneus]
MKRTFKKPFCSARARHGRRNSAIDLCIDYTGKQKGKINEEIDEIVGVYSCPALFSPR